MIAVLLAKSPLSTADIGIYEMLLYIGFTLTTFWVTGLMQGFLALYPQLPEEERPVFLFNAYLLFFFASSIVLALLLWGKTGVLLVLTGQDSLPFYELFAVFLWLNVPSYLVENFYLVLRKPRAILYFGLMAFGLQVLAVLVPVFLGFGLLWSFYALLALGVLKFVWLLALVAKRSAFHLNIAVAMRWVWLSVPLMLYALMGSFNQSFDNWLVNFFYRGDEQAFAVFRYGARELPLALALANAFGSAMLPEVAANLEAALVAIREKSLKLFHLLFPLSIFLVLSSKWLFPLVFNEDFGESAIIFNIFLLVTVSRLLFSRTILVGLNANRMIFYFSVFELAFNVALSFALVPFLGLSGIAIGTVAAYTLEKVLLCWYLYSKFGIGLARYTNMRWYLAYSTLMVLGFVVALFF
ncbi:MAG: polysaccharide biosynthesis C-terminal domain-containing protein [Phaeodactylibacter sp.]|nr:polysaccharide biosynthesis C-terminal domain-containing protein [Phaeodactylibacter sp.]MCB9050323.1 polysaccharide biosynthesis C-terminal domain-containing protein [Lewinellaceae bacterium]